MASFGIFNIAASAMNAQSVRLNTIASNLANADSVETQPEQVYRARYPVFETVLNSMESPDYEGGVRVSQVVESDAPAVPHYEPNHPLADENGYVYGPNINVIEEMADMISASRAYQNNVEVFNTSKQMLMQTLSLGR